MTVYFCNTGCTSEFEDFLRFLRLIGGEETTDFWSADIIIVHFCALSTESFKKIPSHMAVLGELKNLRGDDLKLYVGGCASEVLDLKKRYPFVNGFFRRKKMVEDLAQYFKYNPKLEEDYPINHHGSVLIQSGCLRNCSFCKKAYLSMPLESKPPHQVISDIKSAIEDGFHNIMLLAENSTEYGIDLPENVSLIDLLKSVIRIKGVASLNVYGLNIDELILNPELVNFLRDCAKIHKIQLEVQSLIPEVRKNMGLSSSVSDVLSILKKLERKFIISNIMLGYPGETVANFSEQLKLIEDHNLGFLQANIYDDTPYVPAHELKQIPKVLVSKRVAMFLDTLKRIRLKLANQIIAESSKTPIEGIYISDGCFEVVGYSAIVRTTSASHFNNGERVRFKITRVVSLIDPYDTNQSLILEGDKIV